MLFYLLAIVIVLLAALVAFGMGALLHLQGMASILFIVLVLLVGLAAAGALLWFHFRAKKEEGQAGSDGAGGDVDILISDANRKLRGSQQGAKSLDAVPLVYILGEGGSGKTTTVLRSGLNPELLAGTAPRDAEVMPTPVLNLWFTQLAALLEVGESVRQSDALLAHLVQRTRSKSYRAANSRAAVVCLSAEQLLAADGGVALQTSARRTGEQLRQISRLIGAPLPVYVIVTKLDRVPHFAEYVRNLSNEEARQLLGSSLARIDVSAGVYADQASRALSPILDGLCYRLAEFRVEMLDRETQPSNAPGVYEFPREFGKLRKNLSQYLVELCKPSQLNANPYLRAVHFTGIRAQFVERGEHAPVVQQRAPVGDGATQYINLSAGMAQPAARPAQPVSMGPSRVPQWVFLPRLFPEVILGDKSALLATKQTAPARKLRRILLGALSCLLFLYLIFLTISFALNATLESKIQAAANAIPIASANSSPSLADLQKLDELRQTIVWLQNGAPLTYHFGLYSDEVIVRARRAYFDRFRPMFLNPAQVNWVKSMSALPNAPASNNDLGLYLAAYEPLKAYLITTGNPEKSSAEFLTPVFLQSWLQSWLGSQPIDAPRQALAQKQIDFYANELLRQPPYAIAPDRSVEHARGYLRNFNAEAAIYQAMLSAADKNNPSIDFNKLYPGSASSVTEDHVVRGAFSKAGFDFMQNAIQHPESYANGETWVLGNQGGPQLNLTAISNDLAALYPNDFTKEWHLFLTGAHVVGCGSIHEAPARLNALAGPASPLLELFYTVSHNTAVANPQIKATFQPTQALVDPNATDRLIGPGNNKYVDALLALSGALDLVSQSPAAATDPTAFAPVLTSASAAGIAAQQAAQAFNVDSQFHTESTVLALMQAPIQCSSKLAPSPGAAANGGAGKVCSAIAPLLNKLPLLVSPAATAQASVAEFNAVFAPGTGAIWAGYDPTLKPYLIPNSQGQYVAAPNPPQPVLPKFVTYFSHAARVSSAFYPSGAKSPTMTFTAHFLPSPGVAPATLVVDGKPIASGSGPQQFQWSADTAKSAKLVYDSNDVFSFSGPWSLFQLVRNANKVTQSGSSLRIEFDIDTSTTIAGHKIGSGAAKTITIEIDGQGAEIIGPNFFSGLGCPGPMVKP